MWIIQGEKNMFCSKCGTQLNGQFCANCGQSCSQALQPQNQQSFQGQYQSGGQSNQFGQMMPPQQQFAANVPNGQIRIKINTHYKSIVDLSMKTAVKVKIIDAATKNELWVGTSEQVAIFNLDKPTEVWFTTPASIKKKLLAVTIDPQKGRTYEFTYANNWIGGAKYMLNPVNMLMG